MPIVELRIYAQAENTQGSRQALQEDCDWQGQAPSFAFAPYADVQEQEAQRQAAPGRPRQRCGHSQDQADDSVLEVLLCCVAAGDSSACRAAIKLNQPPRRVKRQPDFESPTSSRRNLKAKRSNPCLA